MTRAMLTSRDYEALPSDRRLEDSHRGMLLYAPLDVILADTTVVRLYARAGRPGRPGHRGLQLQFDQYVLAIRGAGAEPLDPPPFTGLRLIPGTLWPER